MKLKITTPLVIVGQVERNKFKAEVYSHARLIVCSSEPVGGLLPNNDTEERARIIAKLVFIRRPLMPLMFRFWLYVEVQTCFDEILVSKIVGLKRRGGGLYADYEDLSPREAKKIEPIIQSLRQRFEIQKESQKPEWARKLDALSKLRPQFVRTLPPSEVR